ncbi:nuclear transport factor 2 family protein [Nocardioides sp. LHG3406-4]|uniref:nuclear transport factor 2 family protein n=1 Tax=Nocardioides sp. LHG3406-4 TaxID=2804575 RepID=UPI003CE76CAA
MSDTPAAIREFIDATNAGDSDAFVAAFTDDAYLNDWGREFRGHDGVRAWDSTDNIGVQAHFDLLGVEEVAAGDTYVAQVRVSGNGYNGTSPLTFRLREGRIASLEISG